MEPIDSQEFAQILALGREQRSVEFKGPGSRTDDRRLLAQVVRACLSMANNRDGGIVIIGIEDPSTGELIPRGLTEGQLDSWQHDSLADSLSEYADPSISFDSQQIDFEGNRFVVIEVHEFPEIPVLCKRNYDDVLRKGACYVRTRRKPETAEIPTQEDMRDLLDLATEKGVRKFIKQARVAGLRVGGEHLPSDDDLYDAELNGLILEEE